MAFRRKQAIQPQSVWGTRMIVDDPEPGDISAQSARVEIDVRMNDGSVHVVREDLAPHLTATEIAQLRNILASIRAKANAEILPTP